MNKGGFRPNSGRKKGSIPWNKGKKYPQMIGNTNGFKKGQPSWNKDKEMPETMRIKMKGNTNGSGNKDRIFEEKTLKKMRLSKVNFFKNINPDYKMRNRNRRIIENGGFHTANEWETLKAQYNWTCPC